MRRLWRYVRGLDPRLPRSVWTMEIGGFANAFGNGLAFPFLLIYLHNVRGFSLPMVGLIAATSAAAGIATVPVAGIVVDRFGGKRTLIVSLVVLAAGFGGYALVREPWHAFLFAARGRNRERRLLAEPVGSDHRPRPAGPTACGLRAPAGDARISGSGSAASRAG